MKVTTIALTVLMAAAGITIAQDAPGGNPPPGAPGGPGGPGRPMSPLFAALDTNKDGTIDADEIAKAPEALKSLDKNGDGKLTREEVMPARGERRGGGGRGPQDGGGRGPQAGGNK